MTIVLLAQAVQDFVASNAAFDDTRKAEYLKDSGIRIAFSAEISKTKRMFLRSVWPHSQEDAAPLFGDVATLVSPCGGRSEDARAYCSEADESTCRVRLVPSFTALTGGFPCKDVSAMNQTRSTQRKVVANKSCKTGSVLQHIMDLLDNEDTLMHCIGGFLENVTGLAVPPRGEDKQPMSLNDSNLAVLVDRMYKNGWVVFTFHLDPRLFGHPQCRPRFYMIFFSRYVLQSFRNPDDITTPVWCPTNCSHHSVLSLASASFQRPAFRRS